MPGRREALARRWAAARARPEWLCLPAGGLVALLGESPLPLAAGALAVPLVRRRLRAAGRVGAVSYTHLTLPTKA